MSFTVAIVGRPNVGKSTLFNRLVGRRLALVDDRPGVTRDRREGEARLGDLAFKAIDTAGLEHAERDSLTGRMQVHTAAAIAQADAVLFLIDARAGGTGADRAFADLVRKSGKPAIIGEGRQFMAWASINESVYLPEPAGPARITAWGKRLRASMSRRRRTTSSSPLRAAHISAVKPPVG